MGEQRPLDTLESLPGFTAPPRWATALLNELHRTRQDVVTVAELDAYRPDIGGPAVARALRRGGWLEPLRTRGAWAVNCAVSPAGLGAFVELRARLRTHPDTQAAVAGKSVAAVHRWLRRPTAATIGCPSGMRVPRCLSDYRVCRWRPRASPETIGGLPVWRPETTIVFMAARPAQFDWSDIADWLGDIASVVDVEVLRVELRDLSRAVWMKTAYLLAAGGAGVASSVEAMAPAGAPGPYVLGHRECRSPPRGAPPLWSRRFDVLDALLPAWSAEPAC